jgi:hypothetical protein
MAPIKLNIHITQECNPLTVSQMITTLTANENKKFGTSKELLEFLESQDIGSRIELTNTATNMGILERTKQSIHLSSTALTLLKLKTEIWGDIFHFLMFTGWNPSSPLDFLQSWAYRHCCERYWAAGDLELTSSYLDQQVEETISEAQLAFEGMQVGGFEEISFSTKSLTGARKWLEALQPKVVRDRQFSRRTFCPPELVLMGIGYILRNDSDVEGQEILLTKEKRDNLCRLCMIAPESLDRVLDWAIPTFPSLISTGTTAGFYGRFIRLHKRPSLEDMIR